MIDPLFISSPVSVLTGDAARVALETTNDAAYYTAGKGVLSVPLERWQAAQEYERATWLNQGLMLTEDRNTEHAAMFDGYKALPTYLGNVVEIGCGPFTNVRHMLVMRYALHVALVDPLIEEYRVYHPNCPYKTGIFMQGHSTTLLNMSIEQWDITSEFDTLVMINVLSHCQNVSTVFKRVNHHLKTGGYLVFHEPARDINVHQVWDVGHPLSYTQAVIDEFLEDYIPVYKNGDYFIGVKK